MQIVSRRVCLLILVLLSALVFSVRASASPAQSPLETANSAGVSLDEGASKAEEPVRSAVDFDHELDAEKETRRAFQNMANTDALTGVRNKHAYSEYEQAVNRKIQSGELQRLAVVACDINGLKHANDTLGHAAGDKLIKDAYAMICHYFKHGEVFRVGGDEFVVLLQEKGYDTKEEAVSVLNRQVEANIAENGVVVSIGYSVLEAEDRQVRDVFERADKLMYARKQALKAMGAKTRDA